MSPVRIASALRVGKLSVRIRPEERSGGASAVQGHVPKGCGQGQQRPIRHPWKPGRSDAVLALKNEAPLRAYSTHKLTPHHLPRSVGICLAAHRAHFPPGRTQRDGAATPGAVAARQGHSPSELRARGSTSGGPHDRVPTHHLGTHPHMDPLMPNRDLLIWAITGIWRMYTT